MIVFISSDGSILGAQYGNVGQGSSITWVYVVTPVTGSNALISFKLPNGKGLPPVFTVEKDMTDIGLDFPNMHCYAYKLETSVTQYSGTVEYTIRFIFSNGEQLVSQTGSFQVNRGSVTLPDQPASDVYAQILAAYNSINSEYIEIKNEYSRMDKKVDESVAQIEKSKTELKEQADSAISTIETKLTQATTEIDQKISNAQEEINEDRAAAELLFENKINAAIANFENQAAQVLSEKVDTLVDEAIQTKLEEDLDIATNPSVDKKLEDKLDKFVNEEEKGTYLYANVNSDPAAHIPATVARTGGTIAYRDANGRLRANDPSGSDDCVNLRYFEKNIIPALKDPSLTLTDGTFPKVSWAVMEYPNGWCVLFGKIINMVTFSEAFGNGYIVNDAIPAVTYPVKFKASSFVDSYENTENAYCVPPFVQMTPVDMSVSSASKIFALWPDRTGGKTTTSPAYAAISFTAGAAYVAAQLRVEGWKEETT